MTLIRLRKAYQVLRTGELESSTPNANGNPEERILTRLSPHALQKLEDKLPKPLLGNDANDPHFVGYVVGVQRVLAILREGWK